MSVYYTPEEIRVLKKHAEHGEDFGPVAVARLIATLERNEQAKNRDVQDEILDYIRASRSESMGLGDAAIIGGIIAKCGGKPMDFQVQAFLFDDDCAEEAIYCKGVEDAAAAIEQWPLYQEWKATGGKAEHGGFVSWLRERVQP